jgi:hypothetical protein
MGAPINLRGVSHQRTPSAISSPGVVTRHREAACREMKVRQAPVMARLTDLQVEVRATSTVILVVLVSTSQMEIPRAGSRQPLLCANQSRVQCHSRCAKLAVTSFHDISTD